MAGVAGAGIDARAAVQCPGQRHQGRLRLVHDLLPGESQNPDAGNAEEVCVAAAIRAEAAPGPVIRKTIDLHCDLQVRPVEVQLVAVNDHVRRRLGQPGTANQLEKARLCL